MSEFTTGTRLRLTELVRKPFTLVLLLVLPPVVIEMYGVAMSSFPQLPGLPADAATTGRMTGTLFAVAFLAGLVGLFQVISARRGDERLAVAGFSRWQLLLGRLVTMLVVAVAGTAVAFAVFTYSVDVAAPGLAAAVLVAAAMVYGLLGVVIGTLLPKELEGSIALVFLADLDNALSSGLFDVGASLSVPVVGEVAVTDFVPLYHPHELFAAAVLDGDLATEHVVPVLAWLAILLAVAFLAYGYSTGDGWSGLLGRWAA
jgi:hypothetical protein